MPWNSAHSYASRSLLKEESSLCWSLLLVWAANKPPAVVWNPSCGHSFTGSSHQHMVLRYIEFESGGLTLIVCRLAEKGYHPITRLWAAMPSLIETLLLRADWFNALLICSRGSTLVCGASKDCQTCVLHDMTLPFPYERESLFYLGIWQRCILLGCRAEITWTEMKGGKWKVDQRKQSSDEKTEQEMLI